MEIAETSLPGVLQLKPRVFQDARGALFESFRQDLMQARGIPPFVQENQTLSAKGVLRGLHYQLERPQGKLIRVLRGSAYDVAVDIRLGSPSFGRWVGVTLSAANALQLYIPAGFAHGFCAMEDDTVVLYKCTDYYSGAADQRGVIWNDPTLAITWPLAAPVLSDKDAVLLPIDAARTDLPKFESRPR
jgi:dTDP-4-dehydrorhamnose 3,5-epimerase